ncbi:hypothetical protein FB565_004615 [Actinoplanes lutulentus]|uniref:LppU/SCO3897 family protein n=1 Tax=Actinoplanes lutulentus TaxID=1287878 RepID=UPI0016056EF9|nr:hypothetical protein [Actinoplanes lutulentus]MBB2944882.1 hypothetical protein [Actinoplanes lutulentus]
MTSEGHHAGQPAEATSGGPASDGYPSDAEGQRVAGRASAPVTPAEGFPTSYGPPPQATPNGGSPFVVPPVSTFGAGPKPAGTPYGSARVPQPESEELPRRDASPYGSVTPGAAGSAAPYGSYGSAGSVPAASSVEGGALPQRGAAQAGPGQADPALGQPGPGLGQSGLGQPGPGQAGWAPQNPSPPPGLNTPPGLPGLPTRTPGASVPVGDDSGGTSFSAFGDQPVRVPGASLTDLPDASGPSGFTAGPAQNSWMQNNARNAEPTDANRAATTFPARRGEGGGFPLRAPAGPEGGPAADLPTRNGGQQFGNTGQPFGNDPQPFGSAAPASGAPQPFGSAAPASPFGSGAPASPFGSAGQPEGGAQPFGSAAPSSGVPQPSAQPFGTGSDGRPSYGSPQQAPEGQPFGSAPQSGPGFGGPAQPSSPFGGPAQSGSDQQPFGSPFGGSAQSGSDQQPFGSPFGGSAQSGSDQQPFGSPFGGSAQSGAEQQPFGSAPQSGPGFGSADPSDAPAERDSEPTGGSGYPQRVPGASLSSGGAPIPAPTSGSAVPQPRDPGERPVVGSARPVTASASVPGSRVDAAELPPPAPAPQARVYGRPASAPPAEPESDDDNRSDEPSGGFPPAPFSPAAPQRTESSFAPERTDTPFAPQRTEAPFQQDRGAQEYGTPDRSAQEYGAPDRGAQEYGSPDRSGQEYGSSDRGAQEYGSSDRDGASFGAQRADSPFAPQRADQDEQSGGFQQRGAEDRFTPPGGYPPAGQHNSGGPGFPGAAPRTDEEPSGGFASAPLPQRGYPQQPAPEDNGHFGQRPGEGPGAANPFGPRPGEAPDAANPFGARPGDAPEANPFGPRPGEAPAAGNPFGARPGDAPEANPFGPRPGDAPEAADPFGPRPGDNSRPGDNPRPGDGQQSNTYGQRAEENTDGEPSGGFGGVPFQQREGGFGTGDAGVNPQSPARASARASASARVAPPEAPGSGVPYPDSGSVPFPGSGGSPYSMPGSPQFPSSGGPAFGNPGSPVPGPPYNEFTSNQNGPDQFNEHTTDMSGRGNSPYVPAPALPPMPGEAAPGVYPGSPAARATVTPPGPEDTTSWPGPEGDQSRFEQFKSDEPAAAPAPVKVNVRTVPVTLAVVLGAALLLGIVFGLVSLIAGDDEFSVAQGECVTRTADNAPVKADCSTAGAFEVVSIATAKEQCADQAQPYIVVPKDGGDQVLCLKPKA